MKNLKRVFAILLVVAMALTAAGCGGNGGNNGGGTSTGGTGVGGLKVEEYAIDSEAVLASMPSELKGTTITFLSWYDPEDREEKDVIAAFEQKTGITIENRIVDYAGYANKVAAALAQGETPDVMRMRLPLVDLLKLCQPISATGYDFSDKAWDKNTMELYTVGNNCYGTNLVYTPYFLPTMFFYNSSVIEDMGFDDPYELWKDGKWTWSKFRDMCSTWVNENGAEYTGACIMRPTFPAETADSSLIKKSADGVTYELDFTNQMALDCWKYTQEGKQMGWFTNVNDAFDQAKPKLLFASIDASAVQQSSGYFSKTRLRGYLKGVPAPVWDLTEGFNDYTLSMMETIGFGIPKGAKNAKAVPYFLAYLCNFANYNQGVGEGGFFFSEQIKECYMDMMTIEKRTFDITSQIAEYDGTIENFGWQLFYNVDPTQTEQWLQEREYIVQNSMNQYNDVLNTLK